MGGHNESGMNAPPWAQELCIVVPILCSTPVLSRSMRWPRAKAIPSQRLLSSDALDGLAILQATASRASRRQSLTSHAHRSSLHQHCLNGSIRQSALATVSEQRGPSAQRMKAKCREADVH